MQITTIGLDIAKNVFQVHGIAFTGQELLGAGRVPVIAVDWHVRSLHLFRSGSGSAPPSANHRWRRNPPESLSIDPVGAVAA